MLKITSITSNAKQKQRIIIEDGTYFDIIIEYKPMQYGWFITELSYQGFTIRGMRVFTSLNMLHQFKNKLPFGIACFTEANREPYLDQDFSSGASNLYLLSEAEKAQVEDYYSA